MQHVNMQKKQGLASYQKLKTTTGKGFTNLITAELDNATEKTKNQRESYEQKITKGLKFLKKFLRKFKDRELLNKAAEHFAAAIKQKSNRPDGYFYLAYIFHILENNHKALSYLAVARFINPEFAGIEELENDINNYFAQSEVQKNKLKVENKIKTVQTVNQSPENTEVLVNKKQKGRKSRTSVVIKSKIKATSELKLSPLETKKNVPDDRYIF